MHLYVIRHGQSFVNLPNFDGKDLDLPLTPLGEKQAEALAAWLPAHLPLVDVIYCSTLRRAHKTADILSAAYGKTPIEDHRLREIGNNQIDHSPWPEGQIPPMPDWAAYWPTERPFSQVALSERAESSMLFRVRVAAFIEEAVEKHPKQTVIAVCHGGVMDAVFDYCFGVGPWRRCEVFTFNTAVTHFEYVAFAGRETWRLHDHNVIAHLRDAAMVS